MNYYRKYSRIYDPHSTEPFRISRSKIDLFLECPKCFYFDRKLGVSRPSMPAFTLNNAVDKLLKLEFDIHRRKEIKHPLMEKYGIDAVPVKHDNLSEWRENFKGITYFHKETNLIITGAIDDLWQNPIGEYIVVDYKATSKLAKVDKLEGIWHEGYKRQMEIYQWLFHRNGFKVSRMGYFVYANGKQDREAFDGKLEFEVTIIAYEGNYSWVENAVREIKKCLDTSKIPKKGERCEYCSYRENFGKHEGKKQTTLFDTEKY